MPMSPDEDELHLFRLKEFLLGLVEERDLKGYLREYFKFDSYLKKLNVKRLINCVF